MRGRFWPVILLLALAGCFAVPGRALAQAGPGTQPPAARIAADDAASDGNYCAACHTAGDDRPVRALEWSGGIEREVIGGCPAATRVREEVYYTERLILAIERGRAGLPADAALDARIAAAGQGYARLLDMPVSSLDATVAEAQGLRYRLGKLYSAINEAHEAQALRRALLVAALVTLAVLFALGWGLRNVTRFDNRQGRTLRLSARTGFVLLLVLVAFAMPWFREVLPPLDTGDTESLARQAALDVAGRAATAADRAQARAWLLARVGADWSASDSPQGEEALAAGLAALADSRTAADAFWGEARAAREATVGGAADFERAALAADRLETVRRRGWAPRLMAAEWAARNPEQASSLLAAAVEAALAEPQPYRDLELRAAAVTCASLDAGRAVELAAQVNDPALAAWGYWELAGVLKDNALYDRAAEAARRIEQPAARAHALAEIATRSGRAELRAEATGAAAGLAGAGQAYALAEIAGASGDPRLAAGIDATYPAARALAFLRLGRAAEAWSEASRIADPMERSRAQAAVAAAAHDRTLAQQIQDPLLRDRALADVAAGARDVELARTIPSPYYRVQALAALGEYRLASEAAADLADFYPLRALAVALAPQDPQAALQLVDRMDREVDRADALRAIAAANRDEATFRRALDMALAARVRNDPAAPVEASLALAQAVDGEAQAAAYRQAFDIADKISIKYR